MPAASMRLTIVIPVHNEASIVEQTVRRIATFPVLSAFESVNLVLVENGSSDNSKAVVKQLDSSELWPTSLGWICGTSSPAAGIGYAYVRGSHEALQRGMQSSNDWILWSACDTPFGYSDIEAFLKVVTSASSAPIVIGSKGHPQSIIHRGAKRAAMTFAFRMLRQILIGVSVRDSQGTFFVRADIASQLFERPLARDFFYTTEFCFYALRENVNVVEVPIVLSPELRPSTVRPLRDGYKMLRGLLRLRTTIRRS